MLLSLQGGILLGIITLAFGILVIAFPKILSFLVGGYLILIGLATLIRAL